MTFVLIPIILGLIVLCITYIYTRWNKNTRGTDVFFCEGRKLTINKTIGKCPIYDISNIDHVLFSIFYSGKRLYRYSYFSCFQIFLKNGNKSKTYAFNGRVSSGKHQKITTQAEALTLIKKYTGYLQDCGIRCECELEPVRWHWWRLK